jgi:hypothetical protein
MDWLSQACSTAANGTTFCNVLVSAVNTYGWEGINLYLSRTFRIAVSF